MKGFQGKRVGDERVGRGEGKGGKVELPKAEG